MAAADIPPHGVGEDYISELPDALLSVILSLLDTAFLSTRFRGVWGATPLLDDLELPAAPPPALGTASSIAPWTARADTVTRVLASHPGPVALFRLSRTSFRGGVAAAEAWFRQLAAKRARKIAFLCPPEWCHLTLADPLLRCPALEALTLGECHISDPGASAAATTRLTEITLSSTHLSEAALQSVFSGCPALRIVMLKHVKGPRSIRVRSCRNLVLLGVWQYKDLEDLTVEDASCLERLLGDVRLSRPLTSLARQSSSLSAMS